MNNIFMGNYFQVLKVAHKIIGISQVIIEQKYEDGEVARYALNNNIAINIVDNSSDIEKILRSNYDNGVVASFGILLANNTVNRFKSIYNFHPGDVYCRRGKHPLPAAIMKKDKSVTLSVHLIDSEAIDRGDLFAQYKIAIDYQKSYSWNYLRLLNALEFLAGQLFESIKEGDTPLWKWEPQHRSYQSQLSSELLEKMINAESLKEFFN